MAAHFDNDDDEYSDDDDYQSARHLSAAAALANTISLPSDGHCKRLVLMAVLAPIAHTYLAVAQCLTRLVSTSMVESEFIKLSVEEIKSKFENGECRYGECDFFCWFCWSC